MTDEALILRPAQAGDAEILGELTARAYVAGGHLSPDSPYVEVLRDVVPRLDETLVILDAHTDRVVAAITALPHGHVMAEATEPAEWEFRYLAVDPDFWGRGLGQRLIAAVEERARMAGAPRLVLRVIHTNPRAQGLYEHLGYRHVPARDFTFPSRLDPTVTFTLLLYAKEL
jgi:ribosomal protein S18 acetylase RimI-like enzyme